ncbi:MAG TPA: YceI family protein, partial [Thermoanaerobaculia bacterium]|nr:YceI family protein [Thermoanaerobaculia bacterium]
SINTDNDDRDKDLRSANFFDAEKNPQITFKSTRMKPHGKNRFDVTGVLNMHGVSKTITLPVTVEGFAKDPWGNQKAGFSTATTLNRKDFGLNWNKALDNGGMLVGDDVNIAVNIEAAKKK